MKKNLLYKKINQWEECHLMITFIKCVKIKSTNFLLLITFFFFIFKFNELKHTPILNYYIEKKYYSSLIGENRIFFLMIFTLSIGFLIFNSDPGYLPTNRFKKISYSNMEHFILKKSRNINFNKKYIYKMKFCSTCNIWINKKSSHCSVCKKCIFRFDHHCPWIRTCIGLKNYRLYLIFLNLFFLLFSFRVSGILLNIKCIEKKIDFFGMINGYKLLVLMGITDFLLNVSGFLFTGVLISCHAYFGLIGMTTYEFIKYPRKKIYFREIVENLDKKIFGRNERSLTFKWSTDNKKILLKFEK